MEAANDVVKTLARIVEDLKQKDDEYLKHVVDDLNLCIDKLLGVKNEIA